MELTEVYMVIGFALAAYSVIANDSVQTLGTFIASNRKVKWQYLWMAASAVLVATISYSWYTNGGDITYGRLNKIPFQEIQWYHALAPAVLVFLTRSGIPVSTSLLVLSVFASSVIFEKILLKSFMGYGIAAMVAYCLWLALTNFFARFQHKATNKEERYWRVAQWLATGFLWFSWLSHDMANIAVFLPRQLSLELLLMVLAVMVSGLSYIFWAQGGKIQKIVLEKTNIAYVKSATVIDLTYALVLYFFKEMNDIPMSTTWVFVGLLCGREVAIATLTKDYEFKDLFPIVGKDFAKIMFGLAVSVALVLIVQNWLAV